MSAVHYRFWGEQKGSRIWTVYYILDNDGRENLPAFPTYKDPISHTVQEYLLRIVYNVKDNTIIEIGFPTNTPGAHPWGIESILFGAGGVPFRSSSITISFGDPVK
jgi:hypothetical protein